MTKPLDQSKVTDEAMADTEGHGSKRTYRGPTTDAGSSIEDTEGHGSKRAFRGPSTDADIEDTEGHASKRTVR